MACIFNAPGCAGPRSATNECAYCVALAGNEELELMSTVFPLEHMRKLLAPIVERMNRAPMQPAPLNPGRPAKPGVDGRPDKPARDLKHVNKAAVVASTFNIKLIDRSAGDQNCALCSCAGCVNLAVGYVRFTTRKVAKLHGKEDGYEALGNREEQERNIIQFVTSNLPGYRLTVHGSDQDRLDLEPALAVMRSYREGTVFVVSVGGGITKHGQELAKKSWGHWLNAIKKDGQIMFVDFQTDHEQRMGRAFVSSKPILGNFGVEWDKPRLQVIALEPPPPRPTAPLPDWARPQPGMADAGDTAPLLPIPVLPNTSTQPVLPLAAPMGEPTRRQLRGRGVNYGKGTDLTDKFGRQARLFDKYQ